jgi:hypothetical protein
MGDATRRCRAPHCGLPALAWIALCVLDLGNALGEIPGDSPDDTEEAFDCPEDERAAYPEGRPPKARAAAPAATLTDPSDVLAAELRALLDRYVGVRLDRAAVEGIVDERVVGLVRRALAVTP